MVHRRVYRKPGERHQQGLFDYSLEGDIFRCGHNFGEERCLLPERYTTHSVVVRSRIMMISYSKLARVYNRLCIRAVS